MREILFRAKRLDNGEWVKGHLISYEDGRARIVASKTDIFCYEKDDSVIQTVAHFVDPKTVCQYTGRTDKNGVKIFEGDIVKDDIIFGDILWDDSYIGFVIRDVHGRPREYSNWWHELVVVGNIFDNPKLLKEGAE